jgi:hypothetical protein
MNLPTTRPSDDLDSVCNLQNELLGFLAELVGERDMSKELLKPFFGGDIPMMVTLPGGKCIVARLSDIARDHWPSTVYELAHETVHMLNPMPDHTNFLEEGIAVEFSLLALRQYGCEPMSVAPDAYAEALQLVRELPGGAFAAARSLRAIAGSLGAVQLEHLREYAPDHSIEKLQRLASKCKPRDPV